MSIRAGLNWFARFWDRNLVRNMVEEKMATSPCEIFAHAFVAVAGRAAEQKAG